MSGPDTREVRKHYATLAAGYGSRANQACKRAYAALVREKLAGAERVLELGAGSEPLAQAPGAPRTVACDFSHPMLSRADETRMRVVADGGALPFHEGMFDAIFSINLLEHVPDAPSVFKECARVLSNGGLLLAVTPNGDVAWLLEALERMRLKLPEGPHRFLGREELMALGGEHFDVLEHRRFLAFPAGPDRFVAWVDRLGPRMHGWGLFQYVLMRRIGG